MTLNLKIIESNVGSLMKFNDLIKAIFVFIRKNHLLESNLQFSLERYERPSFLPRVYNHNNHNVSYNR